MPRALISVFLFACSSVDGGKPNVASADAKLAMTKPSVTSATSNAAPMTATATVASNAISLTPKLVKSYFLGTPYEKASERFAAKDWSAAKVAFGKTHKGVSKDVAVRAQGLSALSATFSGAHSDSAPRLEKAAKEIPLAADYFNYYAARAYFYTKRYAKARQLASLVPASSVGYAESQLLLADIERTAGKRDAMVAVYENYFSSGQSLRKTEAKYRLARGKEGQGKRPEAVALYRQVYFESPLSSWAKHAKERLDKLAPRRKPPTADELITRGMVYFKAMRNPLSEADFSAARKAAGLTSESHCVAAYHHASSIFKNRNRKRSAPIFDQAVKLCRKAGNKNLTVKSAYQAGRSNAYNGYYKEAIAQFRIAETEDPNHTYRDDARLRAAEVYEKQGNLKKVKSLLSSIPTDYPDGDMRAEALWRVGWLEYKARNYSKAKKAWEKQIAVMPHDKNYWAEGQPQYWLARVHAIQGKDGKALDLYEEAIRKYPLSYYSLLAFSRVREIDTRRFQQIKKDLKTAKATPDFILSQVSRPQFSTPGFASAVEYMKLGLFSRAEAEFRELGMIPPAGRSEITDNGKKQDVWAMAYLYHLIGSYSSSHWMTRWHILDYKKHWPAGNWRTRWEIAYPNAYGDLMTKWGKKRNIPKAMLMGIMREESAFNPKMESYANAIGLTQMIFSTASRFSKGTGVTINKKNFRPNMQNAVKNVTVGSNFLAFLFRKWNNRLLLIPPSYNAGEGAVGRWLRKRGHLDADEWLEEVKVDQPRNYSKRVLSSFFAYSYLYENKIPIVRNNIPSSLY